jgi:hypothetical protein
MLERKLIEKHQQSRQASQAVSQPTSPSQAASGQDGTASTPRSSLTSPEPVKDKEHEYEKRKSVPPAPQEEKRQDEEEVEALSEMMCSLVTNNSGETRYIGKALNHCKRLMMYQYCLTVGQAPLPGFPSSRQKVFNGSTRRQATAPSSR